jgi:hypothetical protein
MGPLVTTDGKTARCTLHGGSYSILFMRGATTVAPPPQNPYTPMVDAPTPTAVEVAPTSDASENPYLSPTRHVQMCSQHPDVETEVTCARCGTPICGTCSFPQADGTQMCNSCVSLVRIGSGQVNTVPQGVMCSRHVDVQAVQYCRSCKAPVCETCDFALPGGVHVCPTCATRTDQGLSAKRKGLLNWAFGLAVLSTIGMVLFFVGAAGGAFDDPEAAEVLGVLFSLFVFIPSLVGTALSTSALDRRLTNPASVWIAIVWNVLILAVFILLSVAGLFMQ